MHFHQEPEQAGAGGGGRGCAIKAYHDMWTLCFWCEPYTGQMIAHIFFDVEWGQLGSSVEGLMELCIVAHLKVGSPAHDSITFLLCL